MVYFCDFDHLEKENRRRMKDKVSDLQGLINGELYCPEGSTLEKLKPQFEGANRGMNWYKELESLGFLKKTKKGFYNLQMTDFGVLVDDDKDKGKSQKAENLSFKCSNIYFNSLSNQVEGQRRHTLSESEIEQEQEDENYFM